jgi:ribosomal protein S18 acetylase RimI-like enzyme
VSAATAELAARGAAGAKVVAGRHNRAALAMYRACGFVPAASVEIHPGVVSEVLTWP